MSAKEAAGGGYESFSGPWSRLLHRHELEKARGVIAAQLMSKRLPVVDAPEHVYGPVA